MEINIKKIKPMFNQIITTANLEFVQEGELITDVTKFSEKGSILEYQTVIAVGESVRTIAPGDVVLLDFNRYGVRKFKKDDLSVKASMDEFYREQVIRFDIPSYILDGQKVLKLYDSDVVFIIEEFEEIQPSKLINTTPKIIL